MPVRETLLWTAAASCVAATLIVWLWHGDPAGATGIGVVAGVFLVIAVAVRRQRVASGG